MKATNRHSSTILGLSFTMLIMSLTACDQGADPDINTTITGDTPGCCCSSASLMPNS